MTATEALSRLRTGNDRFVSDRCEAHKMSNPSIRADLANAQQPFAVVLGCSDSRVPVEVVFDQGLGSLFVIRVAGNIVAQSQIGSVEFALSAFGIRLVVVLGHSQCGAVTAAVDELHGKILSNSENIRTIIDRIKATSSMLPTTLTNDRDVLVREMIRANVRASVNGLRKGSAILDSLIEREGLVIVGGEYSLDTGIVDFFEGIPVA